MEGHQDGASGVTSELPMIPFIVSWGRARFRPTSSNAMPQPLSLRGVPAGTT